MDGDLFATWFRVVFVPGVAHVPKPVLLLLDGHNSHISLETAKICRDSDTILYCLPPHSSHLMQPLDLRLFGVMKQNWKNAVKAYQDKHLRDCDQRVFSEVFKEAWETATARPSLAEEAFEAAGLIPLKPAKVLNNKKLEANQVFRQATSAATVPSTAAGVAPLADTSQIAVRVHEDAGEQMADQDVPAPAHPATSGDLQRMAPGQPGPSHLVIAAQKK